MTTHRLISNATDSPLPVGDREASRSEAEGGSGVRSISGQFLKAAAVSTEQAIEMLKLTKRQIEVTMFAAGVGTLEGLALSLSKAEGWKVGKRFVYLEISKFNE